MTRSQLRDKIRVESNLPGDNKYDFLLDEYINEELQMFTALRMYPEAYLTNITLAWQTGSVPYALLPTDLQHLDVDNIFYNGTMGMYNLARWTRIYANDSVSPAVQFRKTRYDTGSGVYVSVLEITPGDSISYSDDTIIINYWQKLAWIPASDDTDDFPIPDLQTTVGLKVVERIANLQNTTLAAKADKIAREHYTAVRAINRGDKS